MDRECKQALQVPSDHGKAGPSHSRENVIFLSHSGRQKPFVEHLFDALVNANHTVFFDKHSLPKACQFPKYIEEAALGCRLGVVVLSEDFLTSKWPMLELEMLVLQRGSDAKVLPVCYKLNFDDLKSPTNLSRWRSVWNKKYSEHADQWEKVVRTLAHYNGEVFVPETSESAYIRRVVRHICSLVPCFARHDMSSIQGHHRLAEEIANIFERVKARGPEESTCIVGLHGVGGLGKTTLCGSMVNYYNSQYVGRSYLIEFPSDGDKLKIVQACLGALKKLTNLSKKLLLDDVNSFEQVISLMRDHVERYDVFLAIDNVWVNSLEQAKRLLRVGFSSTSKILLTSRSEVVLNDLLMEHTNIKYCVDPLPTPKHKEAFEIFQESFGDVSNRQSLLDRDEIDVLLERCRFGGNYHPLALQALAHHVKRVCTLGDFENRKHLLSVALEEIGNEDLLTVEKVIRLSYDSVPSIKKCMFLDIGVFLCLGGDAKKLSSDPDFSIVQTWMCSIYKELTETKITTLIGELALDGLIQLVPYDFKVNTGKIVSVHDLYFDLAHKEAASSSRFFVARSTSLREEFIKWEKLERVSLWDVDTCLFEKICIEKCKKVRLLDVRGLTMRSEMHLDCMPSLHALWLERVALISEERRTYRNRMEWAALWFKRVVLISEEQRTFRNRMERAAALGRVIKLNALVQLRILKIISCGFVEKITGLDALPNLRDLNIRMCSSLKELECFSCLIRLEALTVIRCESLKTIMSGLSRAERLSYGEPREVEEEGKSLFPSLQRIHVKECGALEKMLDLGGLTCLERLILLENGALEEVGGTMYLSPTLKHLVIGGCGRVRMFPALNYCVHLEILYASQHIIQDCLLLGMLPNLRMLILTGSDWSCNGLFIEQWKHATLLQYLIISGCGSIEKLEVGCLMSSLKDLRVNRCGALEEMGDLSALHRLQELHITQCRRLKVVGGLVGILAQLECLILEDCGLLEESGLTDLSLLESIRKVIIRNCGNLKDWPTRTTQ